MLRSLRPSQQHPRRYAVLKSPMPKKSTRQRGGEDDKSGALRFIRKLDERSRHRRPHIADVPLAAEKPKQSATVALFQAAAQIMAEIAHDLAEAFGFDAAAPDTLDWMNPYWQQQEFWGEPYYDDAGYEPERSSGATGAADFPTPKLG